MGLKVVLSGFLLFVELDSVWFMLMIVMFVGMLPKEIRLDTGRKIFGGKLRTGSRGQSPWKKQKSLRF